MHRRVDHRGRRADRLDGSARVDGAPHAEQLRPEAIRIGPTRSRQTLTLTARVADRGVLIQAATRLRVDGAEEAPRRRSAPNRLGRRTPRWSMSD
ncbi:hypothetical protein A7K94_0203240 [Modestobacter sp. VKM Ac-2676]|nr:hypothetical protein A7K94_0203240 [Modestobacter sp. VKM Ac-2676]